MLERRLIDTAPLGVEHMVTPLGRSLRRVGNPGREVTRPVAAFRQWLTAEMAVSSARRPRQRSNE